MGIGTAAFSVVNAVLLRPPPYGDAKRIVAISDFSAQRGSNFGVTYPRFLDIENDNRSFETVAAFRTFNQTFVLTGIEEPQLLHGARVSKDFFRLFGVRPILGRTFEAEAEILENTRTVVLSHGLWCSRYACDQNMQGRPVILDGEEFTVIGVMPKSFKIYGAGERPMDLWLPLPMVGEALTNRSPLQGDLHLLARLKKSVTLQQAQAEASVMNRQLARQFPETDRDLSFRLSYWWGSVAEQARPALALLSGAVGLLLLIACSSMAFVILAKAFSREKEIAIRMAWGASTSRLAGAFLIEGLLYGSLAGGVGTVVAFLGTDFIVSLVPESIPRLNEASVDGRVLVFSIAMSIFTGLIFGLIPVLSMIRMEPFARLGGGAGTVIGGNAAKKNPNFVGNFPNGRRDNPVGRNRANGQEFLSDDSGSTGIQFRQSPYIRNFIVSSY